jgi:hypothetical protein
MVRRERSALPFCGEVYGEDIRKTTPLEVKNAWEEALLNSRPLSHWTALMMRANYVETKVKKFDNMEKVSDLTRNGKVHTK